jgi:hypothetical protein
VTLDKSLDFPSLQCYLSVNVENVHCDASSTLLLAKPQYNGGALSVASVFLPLLNSWLSEFTGKVFTRQWGAIEHECFLKVRIESLFGWSRVEWVLRFPSGMLSYWTPRGSGLCTQYLYDLGVKLWLIVSRSPSCLCFPSDGAKISQERSYGTVYMLASLPLQGQSSHS